MNIQKLYKYGRLDEYSEGRISNNQIWLSRPSQFNDPFECRPSFRLGARLEQVLEFLVGGFQRRNPLMTRDEAIAKATAISKNGRHQNEKILQAISSDWFLEIETAIGVYCLSRIPDNILMWSHYAQEHKGYCLEFEATDHTPVFGEAQAVSYSDIYPIIDYFKMDTDRITDLAFLTKYVGWAYEEEWRIIDFQTGCGMRSYPAELLTGIIFGLRMSDSNKSQIRHWTERRGHSVRYYQAVQDDRRFSIEIKEVT